ncbi:MAG TPA: cytochrome c biogenesis protein CcsA [Bacteroidales bacterium]|nr:cytochrome c biogenesis protein CcsA [Bacteroidales bacterium]HQH19125.1 cytochrome c biogenesis protein CcsA [Bacteroidales bacterium]HQI44773.1 cytochrome c biogenesis protein CcsA [Bacteroidales bacterium]
MEFSGEHLIIGFAGRVLIWSSFLAICLAAICYLLSSNENRINFRSWRFYARHFFRLHVIGIVASMAILTYITINHYFEYNYVWQHSAKELSIGFLISSVWAGQEGSFLLWILLQGFIGVYLLHRSKKWEMPVMTAFSVSQLILTSTVLGIKILGIKVGNDPFLLLREASENSSNPFFANPNYLALITDGVGLNPLLMNFWMKAHPPILFLGYASTIVPFSFALAALWKNKYTEWLKPVIPWIVFSLLTLGVGILMGGVWAYQDLTFGGFWAWDPVENASLVPWLLLIASLHFVIIAKRNIQSLLPAFILTFLSYIFILYATFLTRSGILSNTSVHAFNEIGQTQILTFFLSVFIITPLFLLILRFKKIPKKGNEQILSKEFWTFIGIILIVLSAFQIILTTSIPLINKIIGTNYSSPADPISYYHQWQIPFYIIIGIILSLSAFLNYEKDKFFSFFKKLLFPLILSIELTYLLFYFSGITKNVYFLLAFASLFIIFSSLDQLFRFRTSSLNIASTISHLGLGLFIFGIVISLGQYKVISGSEHPELPNNPFAGKNTLLKKNDITAIGKYYVSYTGVIKEGTRLYFPIDFLEKKGDQYYFQFTAKPSLINHEAGNVYIPGIKHFIDKDIFNYIVYAEKNDTLSKTDYEKIKEEIVKKGDTLIYQSLLIIPKSFKINKVNNKLDTNHIQINVNMDVVYNNKNVPITATFKLNNGDIEYIDALIPATPYKIRMEGVSNQKDTFLLGIYQIKDDYIIFRSITFPYINIIWIGSIIVFIGLFLSIIKRIKKNVKTI